MMMKLSAIISSLILMESTVFAGPIGEECIKERPVRGTYKGRPFSDIDLAANADKK